MDYKKSYHMILLLLSSLLLLSAPTLWAADDDDLYSFSGDGAFVSKYIWRGQRLTDGWSFQPSGTFGIGNFSINVWGTMDLEAINPGDSLFLDVDPSAPPGDHDGLQGKFSEIDYTFSYAFDVESVSVDVGTIFYTFPNRSASLPTTTELYGGFTLNEVPLAPSATLYIDVDETGDSGDTGLYFLLGAGEMIPFDSNRFPGLEISGSLSFVNSGFSEFYYGASESGAHDFALTFNAPINLGEHWSAGAFLTFSTLLGDFQDYQYQNPRKVFLGTAERPSDIADTLWGGFTVSVGF